MTFSKIALFTFAAVVGISSFVGSNQDANAGIFTDIAKSAVQRTANRLNPNQPGQNSGNQNGDTQSRVIPGGGADFSYLNKMNPKYTQCVQTSRANVGSDINKPGMHDAIIRNCESKFPAF